jgi:hypothetical protein
MREMNAAELEEHRKWLDLVQSRRLVVLESPYAGDVERNRRYLRHCMRDSLERGEAPFASHALYTLALDDSIPDERTLGIACGLAWGRWASATVVYQDLGISKGMHIGIERAKAEGRIVERRALGGIWAVRS